jgi:signal peptidase I
MKNFVVTSLAFLWETAKIVIIALLIILPIRYFVVQPFFVRGESMAPTFRNGEYLIVDEISYNFAEPRRGDVVVFRYPQDPRQFYIKRIIALPGEEIEISDGSVLIYNRTYPEGFALDEPYVREATPGDMRVRLDGNEYFVLGDNRDSSSDSRRWGALPEHLIVGKAWLRAWPIERAQAFSAPAY